MDDQTRRPDTGDQSLQPVHQPVPPPAQRVPEQDVAEQAVTPYGAPEHAQPQGGQPQYGQAPYGTPEYGQPYGTPQYGAPQYGQPPYGTPQYGQPSHGAAPPGYPPAAYGQPGQQVVAPRSGALGLIISFFLPGVGSMVNGSVGLGVAILVGYVISWFFTFVLIGLPFLIAFWVWGLVDGYQSAQRWNAAHGIIS